MTALQPVPFDPDAVTKSAWLTPDDLGIIGAFGVMTEAGTDYYRLLHADTFAPLYAFDPDTHEPIAHKALYFANGRRRVALFALKHSLGDAKTPRNMYNPDGSQVPLRDVMGNLITNDGTAENPVPVADGYVYPLKWASDYDVRGVPRATWQVTTEFAGLGWARNEDGDVLQLYRADGTRVWTTGVYGDTAPSSEFYDSSGRRLQFYWPDGEPASSYNPDGSQIHLYSPSGKKITNDTVDPLWTPPEDPPPEDPPPEDPAAALVTVAELQAFMPDDALDDDLCALSIEAATAVVAAYCRDRHLDARGRPRPGVKTVALTVAARIAANPSGISRQDTAGSFSTRRSGGFTGFTLAELTVLKRYRRKAIGP